MPRSRSTETVTAAEAVTLLERLEPRSGITVRKFRYIAQLLGMVSGTRGATRLYDRADICLVRLCLRLEGETSLWLARAAILYLEPTLRVIFSAVPLYGVVRLHGNRAEQTILERVKRDRLPGTIIVLRDVWKGVPEGMRAIRKRQPEVWAWSAVPPALAAKRVQEIAGAT